MKSDVFVTTFSLPLGNVEAEGASDNNPFVLHGITASDFQALLKVMSPLSSTTLSDMTREEWMSAMKLSTMWGFTEARSQSIQKLSELDISPAEKIVLGKKYHIPAWLKEGVDALIKSEEVMTREELLENAKIVGWETMAWVLRLRNSIARDTRCQSCRSTNRSQIYCCSCENLYNAGATYKSDLDLDEEIKRDFLEDVGMSETAADT